MKGQKNLSPMQQYVMLIPLVIFVAKVCEVIILRAVSQQNELQQKFIYKIQNSKYLYFMTCGHHKNYVEWPQNSPICQAIWRRSNQKNIAKNDVYKTKRKTSLTNQVDWGKPL